LELPPIQVVSDPSTGRGRHGDVRVRVALAVERHVLLGEHALERLERLVEDRAPLVERDAEGVELGLDVAGADAEDRPPARQVVERAERRRRLERVPVGGDPHDRQQAHVRGVGGQVPERGDGVVPGRAHPGGVVVVGDGDVVAHPDERVAGGLRLLRDGHEVGDGGVVLPRVDQVQRERLDRELDPVDPAAVGDEGAHVS
jgi:hypothetical protein